MRVNRTCWSLLAALWLIFATPALAQSADFFGLGVLDTQADPVGSGAFGISADGTRVVGYSFMFVPGERRTESRGFVWTAADGMIELPPPPLALPASAANAISNDGAIVVGNNGFTNGAYYEVRNGTFWTDVQSGNPVAQLMEPAYSINDVTADGTRLIGGTREPGLPWAVAKCMFYYTPATGIVEVGPLPDRIYSWGEACSADGSVMVGWGDGPDGITPIMWTEATGVTELAGRPDGYFGQAFGISADGTAIVGGYGSFDEDAFRWTATNGYVNIGKLDGYRKAYGLDCSADGSVVVGYNWTDDDEEAFIWSERRGMHALVDVLADEYGLAVSDWDLARVTGVSDDGTVLTGVGVSPSGIPEAWMATVPHAWGAFSLELDGTCPDNDATLSWTNATPDAQVALIAAAEKGSVVIPTGPCAGTALGLGRNAIQLLFINASDANGSGARTTPVPANACGRFLQLVDAGSCDVSNVVIID